MHWEPPVLTFEIVRHGAAVSGSVYGNIQIWTVDVQSATVTFADGPRRLVGKRASPIYAESSAEEIAAAIRKGGEDVRLKWYSESKVQVLIGKVLPADSAVQQTVAGRRKRLRTAIRERLKPFSWHEVRANVYQRE